MCSSQLINDQWPYADRRPRDGTRSVGYFLGFLLSAGWIGGCVPAPKPTANPNLPEESPRARPSRIIAQGQIMPASGLVRLNGTPGDAVEKILVSTGDRVTAGQPLIEMRSAAVRQSQLAAAQQQLAEVQRQKSASVELAKLELSAAQLQLDQANQQAASAERRRGSLPLLKQQWDDAAAALERAESIASDPLTKNMISRLDIDRQRSSVTASRLQYEQQLESLSQAEETAGFAIRLAEEKVRAAEKSLDLAQKAEPEELAQSQIRSAELQLASARLTSPLDGTVVSVDARVGENVAQFPLIQVAELSSMICQVEIYQTDAPLVQIGQSAELRSNAFAQALKGRVARVDRLVGTPQLRSTDPLAKIDYRTLPVVIEIDDQDAAVAARWLQLQVEVEISLGETGS